MIVHLVDGTYELFRHFYGLRRFNKGVDRPYGAVVGVLQTVLQMIDRVKGFAPRGSNDDTRRPTNQPRERTLLRGAGVVRRRDSRAWTERMEAPRLLEHCEKAASR